MRFGELKNQLFEHLLKGQGHRDSFLHILVMEKCMAFFSVSYQQQVNPFCLCLAAISRWYICMSEHWDV
jgi:hypothetical protein